MQSFYLMTPIFLSLLFIATTSPAYNGYYDIYKMSSNDVPLVSSIAKDYYNPKDNYKPKPYNFGYNIDDGHGNNNHQHEEGDEYGNKRGSYGYTDAFGIYRKVDYIADNNGYRATITSNEPGIQSTNSADVQIASKKAPKFIHTAPAYSLLSYVPKPQYYKYFPKYTRIIY